MSPSEAALLLVCRNSKCRVYSEVIPCPSYQQLPQSRWHVCSLAWEVKKAGYPPCLDFICCRQVV